jgi:formamidopyrimidine-DNA glycosylase
VPEMPQMQALADRLEEFVGGRVLTGYEPLGFSALKTFAPPPESVVGETVTRVGRRGKYVVFEFANGNRVVFHLSQAGRLDVESPPKRTKPKGSVVRWKFENSTGDVVALLVREFGHERKAGWWVLGPDDDGPLASLGPEATSDEFAAFVREANDGRRVHTLLRDQHTVAGIGRGYGDDILHRAKLSPYASLKSMSAEERERLLSAIHDVLADGLDRERRREGGLSANKLGEHFVVHGKHGVPCPECGDDLKRVSYESHEVVYCPRCQTGGKVLADRRLSRLVK